MIQRELMDRCIFLLLALSSLLPAAKIDLSIDFEDRDLSRWILPKAADWEIAAERGNHFLRLRNEGEIGNPRRPLQYAMLKDLCLGDFSLRVRVRRAGKSMMIAFGYQDTLHFYYAHLSSDGGDHAVHNGLFKVDGGERFRNAGQGSMPLLPDKNWTEIRIVRRVSTGQIEVFADGYLQPRFTHTDTSFRFGRIGLGSFNETGDFDDLRVKGETSPECR